MLIVCVPANAIDFHRQAEQPISSPKNITDILDVRSLVTLRSVTGGSCVLVDPDDVTDNPRPISGAMQLLKEDALLIAKLLLDVESWFYARKQCLPRGTAIIELHSGAGEAQLLIGMDCEAWDLLVGGRRQHGFFDPVADQVRAVLKRTFPEIASPDARSMWMSGAIQRLKYEFSSQQTLAEQSAEPELPNSRL